MVGEIIITYPTNTSRCSYSTPSLTTSFKPSLSPSRRKLSWFVVDCLVPTPGEAGVVMGVPHVEAGALDCDAGVDKFGVSAPTFVTPSVFTEPGVLAIKVLKSATNSRLASS